MSVLQSLNNELAGVVEKIRPNLVQIQNKGRNQSGGAGIIWDTDGLIITNAHVVAPSIKRHRSPTIVLPDGTTSDCEVVAIDNAHDLAALKVSAPNLDAVSVGDSKSLVSGDWVTAIGHPWGVVGAVTSGMVITVGQSPEIQYEGDLIQVGLHMRPGHSGGAMVNDQGALIGINCMIAGPDVGLAIPSATVKQFVKQLRAA